MMFVTGAQRRYSNDKTNPTPTPPAANKAPQVSFKTPSGNITVNEGYKLDAEVNASGSDGSISNVRLYINNKLVRQENKAPYEWGQANSSNPNELNGLSVGTYVFKAVATDNDGTTAEATFTLTVKGNGTPNPTPTPSANCAFGAPTANGLPSLNKANYTNIFVLGNGPDLSNIRRFRINWNAGANRLVQFAFNTANGNPSYYVDLRGKIEQNFSNSNPSVKISGSGIGVDGDYWVIKRGNDFVMASKNGEFTIYCTNGSKPSCSAGAKASNNVSTPLIVSPVPATTSLTISNILNEGTVQIKLYNLNGQQILSKSYKHTGQVQLNVSNLQNGLYFAKVIEQSGKIHHVKFSIHK